MRLFRKKERPYRAKLKTVYGYKLVSGDQFRFNKAGTTYYCLGVSSFGKFFKMNFSRLKGGSRGSVLFSPRVTFFRVDWV